MAIQGCVQSTQVMMAESLKMGTTIDATELAKMTIPTRGTITSEIITARHKFIEYQEKQFDKFMDDVKSIITDVEKEGRLAGSMNLGITEYGIGASIAIAALSAANPTANVVWIAGLGAFTSGLTIFQSTFAREGINRDILGKYQSTLLRNVGDAIEKINFIKLKAKAGLADNKEWEALLVELGEGMKNLKRAILLTAKDITIQAVPNKSNGQQNFIKADAPK
jgi:hypothetical protein